jgi:hypothetical protein
MTNTCELSGMFEAATTIERRIVEPGSRPSFWLIFMISICFAGSAVAGPDDACLEKKSIRLIIPASSGGGTDVAARLAGAFLGKYLPGNPKVVPENMPGGGGITALNYMAQQAQPDGLTFVVSSSTEADPLTFRVEQAHYRPADFGIIGGFGSGDDLLIIRKDAESRLRDRSQRPVIMGTLAGQPRHGMRMPVWGGFFLGWNIKWVNGYAGMADLFLALQSGEIDMSALGRDFLADKISTAKGLKILYTEGVSPDDRPSGQPAIDAAPKFSTVLDDKIKDLRMQAAFDYWRETSVFKWLALPPNTPSEIVSCYRSAFTHLERDPEFERLANNAMKGFSFIAPTAMAKEIKALGSTSDETLATTKELNASMQ